MNETRFSRNVSTEWENLPHRGDLIGGKQKETQVTWTCSIAARRGV